MTTKFAKDLKVSDILIVGKHMVKILEIASVNDKTITYSFEVISQDSKGFGNIGTEYKRLNTKIKTL